MRKIILIYRAAKSQNITVRLRIAYTTGHSSATRPFHRLGVFPASAAAASTSPHPPPFSIPENQHLPLPADFGRPQFQNLLRGLNPHHRRKDFLHEGARDGLPRGSPPTPDSSPSATSASLPIVSAAAPLRASFNIRGPPTASVDALDTVIAFCSVFCHLQHTRTLVCISLLPLSTALNRSTSSWRQATSFIASSDPTFD